MKIFIVLLLLCSSGVVAFGQCASETVSLGEDLIVCNQSQVTISVAIQNSQSGTPTYSWTHNGTTILGQNANNLIVLSDQPGTYEVTVTFSDSCEISDTIIIDFLNAGIIGSNQIVCNNGNPNILNNLASANINTNGIIQYTWQSSINNINWTTIIGATSATYDPPLLSQDTYFRRVASVFINNAIVCSENSNSVFIDVLPNITISTGNDIVTCAGENVIINPTTTGTLGYTPQYSWTGPNNTSNSNFNLSLNSVQINSSGTYTFSSTIGNCIVSDQIEISVTGFTISSDLFNASNTQLTSCLQPQELSGDIIFTFNLSPLLNNIQSVSINWGDGSSGTIPTSAYSDYQIHTYLPGSYTLTATLTSTSGCTQQLSYPVFVGSSPSPAALQIFVNQANGCLPHATTYTFSVPQTNVNGTTYTVSWGDGTPDETYTHPITPSILSHIYNTSSCGSSVTISGITYSNVFQPSVITQNPCSSQPQPSAAGLISIGQGPDASFTTSATTICPGSSVQFNNTSNYGLAIPTASGANCGTIGKYYWTITPGSAAGNNWTVLNGGSNPNPLGTNNNSTNQNIWVNGIMAPNIVFNNPGIYTVQLFVKNGLGNTNTCGLDIASQTICVIQPPTSVIIPNNSINCSPSNISLSSNSILPLCGNSPIPVSYQWSVTNSNCVECSSNVSAPSSASSNFTLINNSNSIQTFTISLTVNPLHPTTNQVLNNLSCSSSSFTTVQVYPQPTITAQPLSPSAICVGGSFPSLSVVVNYLGLGSPVYQWYSNNSNSTTGGSQILGATEPTFIPTASIIGTQYYYCVITFPGNATCNMLTSNVVPASVLPDPISSVAPSTQTVCVGGGLQSALTSSYTNGVGTPTYQWNTFLNGTSSPITNAISSSYAPSSFDTTGSFYFTATINTSGSGCDASTSAPIEVIVIPDPTIITQPTGNSYCQNTAAVNITSLSVVAAGGSGNFSYQWFVNTNNSNSGGTAISGATSASFSPPSVTVGTFYYYCEISQPVNNCSVTSNPAQIIIVASPTFTAQPLNAQTLCTGGPTSPLSVVTAGGTGNVTYQWYSNTTNSYAGGTLINGATQSSFTPPNTNTTLPNTTYYYCIVSYSDGGCPSITSNISAINIYPALIISTQPLNAETICIGGTSSNLTVSILAGTGTGNYSYQWYSNSSEMNSGGTAINGATSATLPPQVFNSIGAYYFYCLITDSGNGCGSIASAVATVNVVNDPSISVQPLATQSICQNAAPIVLEINASGGNGTLQYQWYANTSNSNIGGMAISGATSPNYIPSSTNIGTYYYYCEVTTPTSGCSVFSNVSSLIVIPGPTFTTQPASSVVCQGGSVQQLCVSFINGTGTPQYQWYSNSSASTSGGVAIPNANSNCYTPASNVVGTTYYYCQINLIGGGCSSILSNISSVIVYPIPVAQPIADLTFCNQETTSAVLLNSNEQNTTFQWSFNNSNVGNPVLNGVGNSIPSFVALNNSTNVLSTQVSYTPVYTNSGVSCSGTSSSFNIFVNPTPSMSLFNPELFVFCEASQGFVPFSSNISSNISYTYTNDNNLIGVPSSGTISSPSNGLSFLAVNNSNQPLTSNFLVSPVFTNNNQVCIGNTVYFAITVNPLPDITPVSSQTVCATETASNLYSSINPIIGPGTNYVWTNTNPAIGMASTGVGSNYFTSTNTTQFPISGTISVAPTYTNNGVTCQGSSISFDLIVNPMPSINPISNQSLCLGDLTETINPSGPIPNTIFNWNNNNNSIGLGASGSGIINSFLGLNSTNQANSTTINYTPFYTNNNVTCSGQSIQVGIVVNPFPILQSISNIEICAQSNVSVPFLTTNNISNTVFQWTNSNSQIGLPLNGEGPISFYAQNSTSSPISATVSVTALYVHAGDTCVGSTEVFTIEILPTPTINSVSNQTICANSLSNAISFQANYSGTIFNWSNSNANIGLGASGNGNIIPFTGTNNGTNPIQGLLTITPSLTTNSQVCSGTPVNATVTINPLPIINSTPSSAYCEGEFINVFFSSNISSNVTYDWTNSNPSNGLNGSGTGNLSFTASNNTLGNETSSISATPIFNFNGVSCLGNSNTFNIEIIPTPEVNQISDMIICNSSVVSDIIFSSTYNTADFNWTNSAPSIGLSASGMGNISTFSASNSSNSNPVISSIQVTPFISQSNLTCLGTPENFTITILPTTAINPISNQTYCNQDLTQFIPITGTGNSFSWTNSNTNIGLTNAGNGGINSFQTTNNSNLIDQSNITVFSGYTLNGVSCPGNTTSFSISVLPTPTSNSTSDITICNGISVPEIIFSGNATSFNWNNSNAGIGLANSGSGNINSFTAINLTSNAVSSVVTYTPVLTSNNFSCFGSNNSFTINVQASPIFVMQPIPTQSVCLNGTINTLNVQYSNGNGIPSYQWYSNTTSTYSNGIAIQGATTSSFTPSSLQSGTTYYYCMISFSGAGGCSMINSNFAEVIVVDDALLSTQPASSQVICIGGSIPSPLTINYTGGVGNPTYQWFNAQSNSAIPGANGNAYTPPNFTVSGSYEYYATINFSGSGCESTTSEIANVIVVDDPAILIESEAAYCQNAASVVPLNVTVSDGSGIASYQWYSNSIPSNFNGNIISGANTSIYTPNINLVGTTFYYCIVTQSSANCSNISTTVPITVSSAPTFTSQPIPTQTVCIDGATSQLNVNYTNGTGTASYQWYANTTNTYAGGIAITGQNSSSFTPPSFAASTDYYYCIISFSSDGGCAMINSNIAQVIVLPDPTISLQPLTTQTICVGGTIPLAFNINYTGGVGNPTYQWFSNPSASIVGATNNSYTPGAYVNPGTFSYYATISLSGSGCDVVTTANATVVVIADPTTTISSGATYCQNAASVNSLSVVLLDGEGTNSYQWYSNTTGGNTSGSLISGATTNSFTPPVTAIGSTYYYCVITQTGANCAVNSPASQIIVTPAPTFTTQPINTQSVCIDGATTSLNVAYTNGTGTASYQWYQSASNSYANGTVINGEITSSYTPPSNTASTVYYYCIISFSAAGGCSMINSNIAEVIVLPDPTISVEPLTTQTICVGGTIPLALDVNFTGGVGNPTYQWFSNSTTSIAGATNNTFTPGAYFNPGTFSYFAIINLSGSGCDALVSANATVIVVADPIVSLQPLVTQSVCQNTVTAQLSVSTTGGSGNASYQWFSNTTNSNTGGTIITGATANTYSPPSNIVGTQFYYCEISQTGTNCSVVSNTSIVIVNLAPIITTQPIASQELCLNAQTSNLEVVYSNGTGIPTYQWYVNLTNSTIGGTAINSATSNIFTPPSNTDGTFYYYCIVSFNSGGGCPSITSNISELVIHPFPIVSITGGETICLLESSDINFAFTPSSGLYDITISSNGQSSILQNYNGANPIYTVSPTQTTTYVVTNIAYDQVPQCAIQPNTSVVVVVNPLPALNNSNYTFCSDVASTSLQYIPDANSYTYDWLPNPSASYLGQNNGPNVITVTLPDPVGNIPTSFYYVSNLTNNATGCQALDSILVTINPNPVGAFSLPTIGCINSDIVLTNGDATIGNYEWYIDGQLYSTLANPVSPVFNSLGIHTIEMIATNTYGCTDTLNSSIQIYDQPVANFSTDLSNGCAPLPVNFSNLSTGSYITSYDWTFAPDTVSWNNTFNSTSLINPPTVTYLQGDVTTTYVATLSVTNACGTVTTQQNITVLPTPVAAFTFATPTICSGTSLIINNISVGEPLSYSWAYGNTISTNPNLQSMFFPSDSVTQVYPLTLTLTNLCGTDSFIDSVTVLPDLVNGGFITSIDAGCSPLTVTFSNTTFNTNLSSIWHLDDPLNTIVVNQSTVQFTYYATNNTTQYYNPYLVVTDGCANDTIYANLSVFANPLPAITASQINICEGSTIDFSGSVIGGGNGVAYAWDFGGLGSANTQNASFNFADGTNVGLNVPVTLTVSAPNNFGTNCSNTTNTVIHVYSNPDLSQVSLNTNSGCSLLDVEVSNLPSNLNLITWGDGAINTNSSHTYVNNSGAIQSFNLNILSSVTYPTIPILVCTSVAVEDISIHPSPLPVIAASATQSCEGQTIDFAASTSNNQNLGVVFNWNIGSLATANTANTSFNFTDGSATGVPYQIQLTASQTTLGVTCSSVANTSVIIYDTPDLTPATFNTTNGCSNLIVNIANLPSATNQINWGDGNTNFTNSHTYTNNGPGLLTYQVSIVSTSNYNLTSLLACTSTTNQLISVYPTPISQLSISEINVCEGENVSFNAASLNDQYSGIEYNWNFGNLATSNAADTTFTFTNGSAIGVVYPIQLTTTQTTLGVACSEVINSSVIVFDTPDLTTTTFNVTDGCSNLNTSIANLPTAINQINWGDGNINFSNAHTYTNNGPGLLTYPVSIVSTSNYNLTPLLTCTSTINELISVYPTPIPQLTSSAINICEGESVIFNANSLNNQNSGIEYFWDFGSLGTNTSNNPTIQFSNGSITGTSYPVELFALQTTMGVTCQDSTNTSIIVFDTPEVTPVSFNTTSGCSELEVILSNLPSATNQINWGDGITNFTTSHIYVNNGNTLLNYPVTLTSTSSYATVAPQLNCVATTTQNISVYPTPLPQIFSSAINVCEGGNIDFIASTANNQNSGITYLWNFGPLGTSSSENITTTFTNGSSTGLTTNVSLTAFQNTSGTICDATASEIINVFDTPDLSTAVYSDLNDCSPLLVSISNLPTSTYTYNWGDGITTSNPNHIYLNQGAIPLNYNVTIDATTFYPTLPLLSCNSVANQIIQVNPQPFAAFTINPSEGCFYNPVTTTLENTSVNAVAPYVWNYDGVNYTTNSLNYIATFNTPGAHPVELVVTNQFGCTDSVQNDFIIHELPTVTLNTIDDDLCVGATAEFEIDGTGISTSQWNFGDGISLNLLNPSNIAHYYSQPGTYDITAIVTNIYGCSDTTVFLNEVIIHPAPIASFTTNTITADIVYPYFEFYDNSSGAINYYWSFGDNFWSNDIQPTHTYSTVGDYVVELTVSNEYSCYDVASLVVHVEGIVVHVPNAFTPLDYNGVNDTFKPIFSSTEGIEFYELTIYNRWGIKIFQTFDIDEAWIGNSKENPEGDANYYAQNDVYTYTVRYRKKARATDPQPDQIIEGHVTIIR